MPIDSMPVVTPDNFQEEVLDSRVPVLVDFATAWCQPCRVLAPVLARLAAENVGRLKVVQVAGDESPDLAARFSVKGYPTVIAFHGGAERARHLGATTKENLLRMIAACG